MTCQYSNPGRGGKLVTAGCKTSNISTADPDPSADEGEVDFEGDFCSDPTAPGCAEEVPLPPTGDEESSEESGEGSGESTSLHYDLQAVPSSGNKGLTICAQYNEDRKVFLRKRYILYF